MVFASAHKSNLHARTLTVTLHGILTPTLPQTRLGMHCGPCIRTEARKEECKLPRCEAYECSWKSVDKNRGCHVNGDGILPDDKVREVRYKYTLWDCQYECEKDPDCNAVGYEVGLQQHKCMLFRKACKHPYARGWGSYAMSGPPPST